MGTAPLLGPEAPPRAQNNYHLVAPRALATAFPEFLRTHYSHYFSLEKRQETLERAEGCGLVLVYRWAVQTERFSNFSGNRVTELTFAETNPGINNQWAQLEEDL